MIRAVIDTNVLISGLLVPNGNEALILLAVQQGLVRPCFSEAIMREYEGVLARPKFSFEPEQIATLLAMLRRRASCSSPGARKPARPILMTPSSCTARKKLRRNSSLLATSVTSPMRPMGRLMWSMPASYSIGLRRRYDPARRRCRSLHSTLKKAACRRGRLSYAPSDVISSLAKSL